MSEAPAAAPQEQPTPDPPQDPEWQARTLRRRNRAAMQVLDEAVSADVSGRTTEKAAQRVPLTDTTCRRRRPGGARLDELRLHPDDDIRARGVAPCHLGGRIPADARSATRRWGLAGPRARRTSASSASKAYGSVPGGAAPRHRGTRDLTRPPLFCTRARASSTRAGLPRPLCRRGETGGRRCFRAEEVWTPETTATLREHVDELGRKGPVTLPGLMHDHARVLAAEAMLLMTSPLVDVAAPTKRAARPQSADRDVGATPRDCP